MWTLARDRIISKMAGKLRRIKMDLGAAKMGVNHHT